MSGLKEEPKSMQTNVSKLYYEELQREIQEAGILWEKHGILKATMWGQDVMLSVLSNAWQKNACCPKKKRERQQLRLLRCNTPVFKTGFFLVVVFIK